MVKVHIPVNPKRAKAEARKAVVENTRSKANPTNREVKDLLVVLYEEIQDLKEHFTSQ